MRAILILLAASLVAQAQAPEKAKPQKAPRRAAPAEEPSPAATTKPAAPTAKDHLERGAKLYVDGKYDEAIAAYQAGLALEPKNADLLFDLGIAYRAKGDLEKARTALKDELNLKPADADAHLALAELYDAGGYRAPAVLAYVRWLALAPDGSEVREVYASLQRLMGAGIEKDRHDPESFSVSSKEGRKDEGDFSQAEMLMTLIAAAAQYSPEEKQRTDAERFVKQLQAFTGFLAQSGSAGDAFASRQYVPFLAELNRRGLVEALGYRTAEAAGKSGGRDWLAANGPKLGELKSYATSFAPAR